MPGTEETSTNKIIAFKNPLNYRGEIDENEYQMQHDSCCAWGLSFSPLRIFLALGQHFIGFSA